LTYKVDLQEGYSITGVNVNMSFKYNEVNPITEEVTEKEVSIMGKAKVNANDKYVLGEFDISEYAIDPDTLINLTIKSVDTVNGELNINDSYSFRFGR